MPTEYALFDILIRAASPGNYTVDVRSVLGGDARSTFTPPFGNPTYDLFAKQLQDLETDEDGLVELGQFLFHALFQGSIKDVYKLSQGGLKPGQGLRLRLDIDPALTEIIELPWEFLYDPDRGPLATLNMSVVRYLSQQSSPAALATPLPIHVLVTGAVTPPEPDVKRELDEVCKALAELEEAGYVKIHIEEHLTRTKLQRLLRGGFQIWHFIGHGAQSKDGKSGTLVFEDSTGSAESISARELGIYLDSSGVQLIVLDACNSAKLMTDPYRSIAPALIRAQVPAVIAMQFTVPQEATRAFAAEFYRTLAEGFPIDACVTEGRKAIIGTTGLRKPDWGIPVIYTRAPDGKLFERPIAQPATLASTPTTSPTSGTNISIGDSNKIDGLAINVEAVGNSNISGSTVISGERREEEARAEQIEGLKDLIRVNNRKLNKLQLQAAQFGISTPPHISIEIEDTEREVAKLKKQLQALGG